MQKNKKKFSELMDLLYDGFIVIPVEQDENGADIYWEPDLSEEEKIWNKLPDEIKELALDRNVCETYFKLGIFNDEEDWKVEEYFDFLLIQFEQIFNY